MADRILGMGDMLTLIEQAERTMDQEVVARSAGKLMSGRFTLDDFLEQLHQVQKMGSLGGILKLMPGMSKEIRQAADQIDDGQVSRVEAIIRSMTPGERADPVIVDGSRRVRIARGSGSSTQEVNQLLKQFKEMQKMMRGMNPAAMGAMGGGGRLGKLAAARGLAGGSAGESLAEMLGERDRAPAAAAARPVGGAKGRGGRNKKKGGRVTPPKGR
jgi:signal recognition particle subunit SRP54